MEMMFKEQLFASSVKCVSIFIFRMNTKLQKHTFKWRYVRISTQKRRDITVCVSVWIETA